MFFSCATKNLILILFITMHINIEICSNCLIKNADEVYAFQKEQFLNEVELGLQQKAPQTKWKMSFTGCQRFCPPAKVTLVINQKLSMSREATVASVVQQCLAFRIG